MHRYFIIAILMLTLLLSACTPASQSNEADPSRLQVVATTSLVGDVVRQIGGEQVDLVVLMSPGIDPHSYTPRPSDTAAIHDAQVLFTNGLGLEANLDEMLDNAGGSALHVDLSAALDFVLPAPEMHHPLEEENQQDEAEHAELTHSDPHVWFSVPNVISWSNQVEQTLSTLDPQNASLYQENAQAYIEQLQALDGWIFKQIALIPEGKRQLVTNHPAFAYFTERYGLEQAGAVYPLNPSAEPSAQDVAALQDLMRELGVQAIFTESTVNPRLSEQIAADSGATLVRLYTGSLGEPGSKAETYIEMMRYDTQAIVTALK